MSTAANHLPADHPERWLLANEIHARPQELLLTPESAAYLALLVDAAERGLEREHLRQLCDRYAVAAPAEGAGIYSGNFGEFRLRWERHGEFSTYTVVTRASADPIEVLAEPLAALPPLWLKGIVGRTIAAAQADLIGSTSEQMTDVTARAIAARFGTSVIVGGQVGGGIASAYTNFTIQADGFVRFLLIDRGMVPRQAGRMVQRLFEIEAYRVLALLALPAARSEAPRLLETEQSLARLTDAIARADQADESLLSELTELAGTVERALASKQYRFGASRAYYDLVNARIGELREQRLPGLQTIEEFMGRRLGPAMATCESILRRLKELSERVARASSLLSTRVNIAREQQNQALLESMDRRARLALRLQQTVEGLSVVAITYYVAGLLAYLGKALQSVGAPIEPDIVVGIAIPIVAVLVAVAVRKVRRRLIGTEVNA